MFVTQVLQNSSSLSPSVDDSHVSDNKMQHLYLAVHADIGNYINLFIQYFWDNDNLDIVVLLNILCETK